MDTSCTPAKHFECGHGREICGDPVDTLQENNVNHPQKSYKQHNSCSNCLYLQFSVNMKDLHCNSVTNLFTTLYLSFMFEKIISNVFKFILRKQCQKLLVLVSNYFSIGCTYKKGIINHCHYCELTFFTFLIYFLYRQ